jgi:hypothetical protein
MDPLTTYEFAKLRIAERHEEAARALMAGRGRALAGVDEQETLVGRRWTFRQLVGRISLGHVGA